MKVLCALLPHFPWRCEIRRHPSIKGRPAIVLHPKDASGPQNMVLDHSPGLEGLRPDMSLQEALAHHGEAELLPADVPYYWSVFNEILDRLESASGGPLVEGTDLGYVYIGVDGLQLIYPDDTAIIDGMRRAIPEDFAPQMGIAENRFLAYLAARGSPPGGHQILSGTIDSFLRDLPCDVLPVSVKSLSKLRAFGLATLGQVASLPQGPFQSQFGPEGKRIWELARGHDDTPVYPRSMEEVIEESTTLPSVTVSLEAILAALESLLARLFARNTLKGKGIRSLTVWTRSWNSEHWERNINFKEPAMEVRSTASRIKRVLESFPQPGPVEQVGIRLGRNGLGYPYGRQKSLFSDIRAKEHLSDDIRQLELKLGNPQVYQVKEVEPWSRMPERRYALTPTGR